MLAGISLIRNGTLLNYPYIPCVVNMLDCCDIVVVAVDSNNDDNTLEVLKALEEDYKGRLVLVESEWNLGETNAEDHNIRADQAIAMAEKLGATSVLYCQADEIVHPQRVKELISFISPEKNNIYLERTSLFMDMCHINKAWTLNLCRICPITSDLRSVEAAMTLKTYTNGYPDVYIPADVCRIFHTSRVGNAKNIAKRLNSLRVLFDSKVEPLEEYDFVFGAEKKYESTIYKEDIIEAHLELPPLIEEFYKQEV